jgi:GT2 family glycosyltransferase
MAVASMCSSAMTRWPRTGNAGPVALDGRYFTRAGRRLHLQGVTYGPFAPDDHGHQLPADDIVRDDFARMRDAGINAVRVYCTPPEWFLDLADQEEMLVLLDVPWSKHTCFLSSARARDEAQQQVRQAARRGRDHDCVLAYSVGNEIPADVVRWHGARRVERFVAELADIARQEDPRGLVTYANFPPTEYLDLSTIDFATFNVYLHDRAAFRRYLLRLQNLLGDRPLVLGELGMDTLRHGELDQARFLDGHLRETALAGLAGTFVFSWTDEWHTGGSAVEGWAFGITRADRSPKAAYHALREVFSAPPSSLLRETPLVSIVVCSYNGGRTLGQCLESLRGLDYPAYEVIVVDDGSTDQTRRVLARFPEVRAIHQPNLGLSAARNAGLAAAVGSIIAYTDSDCFVDSQWLTQLVAQLDRGDAVAVGGPNLTPDDGDLAACVAASPGQPTHVLENDQVAEHIPGCNMAFRREALEAINGFDPQFRSAGDDVDVCWRLQQAGGWITFAPGAFVWHHRRQTPRTYLCQQAGYGEAEALLWLKHPDKFNRRGGGKWRGVVYGGALAGLRLTGSMVYRGAFGAGLFQCLYQAPPAHWAMAPATLEWHLLAALGALVGFFWTPAWMAAALMLALSLAVAGLQAAQAPLDRRYQGLWRRLLVGGLCYAQPLVRSWVRYKTRFFCYHSATVAAPLPCGRGKALPLSGVREVAYWGEDTPGRAELLRRVLAYLAQYRWGRTIDAGWSAWDVEFYCHPHPWTVVRVATAEEEHGSGRLLLRVRYRLRATGLARLLALSAATAAAAAFVWPWAALASCVLAACCLAAWWRGAWNSGQVVGVIDAIARDMGLLPCSEGEVRLSDARATRPSQTPARWRMGMLLPARWWT